MTTIETVEQAIEMLNEKRYRSRNNWEVVAHSGWVISERQTSQDRKYEYDPVDAIAIAQSLLDRDKIAGLKQRISELTRDFPGDCNEHAYHGHRPCPWCRLSALRLAVQPFVEVARQIPSSWHNSNGADYQWDFSKDRSVLVLVVEPEPGTCLMVSEWRALVATYDGKENDNAD